MAPPSTSNKQDYALFTSIPVMIAFVLVMVIVIVFFIAESSYISTVTMPTGLAVLVGLYTITKLINLSTQPMLYVIGIGFLFLLSGYFVYDSNISMARIGMFGFAITFVVDAFYSMNISYKYGSLTVKDYISPVTAVTLAIIFAYYGI